MPPRGWTAKSLMPRRTSAFRPPPAPPAPLARLLLPAILALAAGIAVGLYLGWVAAPVEYVDAGPDSLHSSFKDDYILMIATAYAGDGDLAAARVALASLALPDPAAAVRAAQGRLAASGLPAADQERLAALAAALASSP
jgi:hypothetical protein